MVIWRGWGWVTIFILVGCETVIPGAWRWAHGMTDMAALRAIRYDTPFAAALLVSGALMVALGLYLNRDPNRLVLERTTGRSVRAGGQHTFYYLRVEYWGFLALAGGTVMLALLLQQPDRWADLAH